MAILEGGSVSRNHAGEKEERDVTLHEQSAHFRGHYRRDGALVQPGLQFRRKSRDGMYNAYVQYKS